MVTVGAEAVLVPLLECGEACCVHNLVVVAACQAELADALLGQNRADIPSADGLDMTRGSQSKPVAQADGGDSCAEGPRYGVQKVFIQHQPVLVGQGTDFAAVLLPAGQFIIEGPAACGQDELFIAVFDHEQGSAVLNRIRTRINFYAPISSCLAFFQTFHCFSIDTHSQSPP